jgi:hypothetical protein
MTLPGIGIAFSGASELRRISRKCVQCCNDAVGSSSKLTVKETIKTTSLSFRLILEEAGNRIVKPVMQWWMAKHYEYRHGGPLPDDMVKENAYWEQLIWNE